MADLDDRADIAEATAALPTHPEEMRASVDVRLGPRASLRATARVTPAGLVTAGIMVSAILLSVAALARALRSPPPRRRW